MRPVAATQRSRGGLFVLLAFLLSLLPTATQTAIAAVPNERLAVQLAASLAYQSAVKATIPQASETTPGERDPFGGDGGGTVPRLQRASVGPVRLTDEHVLPPTAAPAASAAADAYQARAPPAL